jgi:23S rRNA (guanosine2251-2'-O)-methyltransferase
MDYVFGLHAVESLLDQRPADVKKVLVQKGRDDVRVQQIADLAKRAGVAVVHTAKNELSDLVEGNHQGVVAICREFKGRDESELSALLEALDAPALLLVLDGVTDPHNLGACLRSADAAGVHAVIAPKDKSVGITSTVRKVACGAAENVPFFAVTNLARTLKNLQDKGVWVVGTAGEAEDYLWQYDFKIPTAIVMGAEGKGMRRLTRECCDYLVKLPMAGSVSSLNVSVATGIALFEAVRQRR